jgi:tetratricopeptide (TPR) repeat protein
LAALAEAVAFYQQAVKLEPTPARRLGLGEALLGQSELETGREQLHLAAAGFEEAEDCLGASRTYLALGLSFMTSGQGEEVVRWAQKALAILDAQPDADSLARAHHLLAAGGLLAGHPLAEAEAHLVEAIRLTTENELPELDSVGRFELGNLLAQRGDLTAALKSFEKALVLAEASGGLFQRVLAHNNLAYHSMLAGDLATARQQSESGLGLVEKHALLVPRQYLYSTSGEIALAEGNLDGAKIWFERALAEANRNSNQPQAANIRANMGLVARERGNLDESLLLLEEARAMITGLTTPHLQSQIDLWLAELFLLRGERTAAEESLSEAEARLMDGERQGLLAWAGRVRSKLAR